MSDHALFQDRRDAGRRLAQRLGHLQSERPIVLALPRGGVEVGFEVARLLRAPLDVIVSRKLASPMQPELGFGAVAPGNVMLLDREVVDSLGLSEEIIEEVVERERLEMNRRLKEYRGGVDLPDLHGRTAIIVDDGLATGVTALAATRAVRSGHPDRIVLAVPICAPETAQAIDEEIDELVCLSLPERFVAVGIWYRRFEQTSDAEVVELLEEARGMVSDEEIREL